MKIPIIFILFIFFLNCNSNNRKKETPLNSKKEESTNNDKSKVNYEFNLETKLESIERAKIIRFEEKDLAKNIDSINNLNNFILRVSLNTQNNIETFQLLNQLKTSLGLIISIDGSRKNRDGFNLLKNIEFLEISGATDYHIKQLKGLKKLRILNLEFALIDSFPLIFDNNLNLHSLKFDLSKINHIPDSFTNQPFLEKLTIIKTNIYNLPLDNSLKRLKKLYTYRAFGLYLNNNLDSIESLESITLDKKMIANQKDFKISNFRRTYNKNNETITYKKTTYTNNGNRCTTP